MVMLLESRETLDVKRIYDEIKETIIHRLEEFKNNLVDDEKVFSELVFCLLTPQSKAKVCWRAVESIMEKKLLFKETPSKEEILEELRGVRFRNKKTENILKIRDRFIEDGKLNIRSWLNSFNNPLVFREWLVENITGMGYKEASHFLRNIGLGEDFAILDRHILKNLVKLGVIDSIPNSLSKKKYMEIEEKMKVFAENIGIPMSHLDFVLWYKETSEVFK